MVKSPPTCEAGGLSTAKAVQAALNAVLAL